MKRDYKLYLNDIRDSITQIEEYMLSVSEENFKKNKLLQDGVIRRYEIIGEANGPYGRILMIPIKDFQSEGR